MDEKSSGGYGLPIELAEKLVVGGVAHEAACVVTDLGVREVGDEGIEIDRGFQTDIGLFGVAFEAEGFASFCHAAEEDGVGLVLGNGTGDRLHGSCCLDGQLAQSLGGKGDRAGFDKGEQIVRGVAGLLGFPGGEGGGEEMGVRTAIASHRL